MCYNTLKVNLGIFVVCQFQSGDTVLIGAVRGGHVEIVRALLHKYADIDIRGQVSNSLFSYMLLNVSFGEGRSIPCR